MTYAELKKEIESLNLKDKIKDFQGFEESFEFEHFKTFFAMLNEPKYTLMQCKDNEEFNTSSNTWFLCLPKNEKLYAIDAGSEEDICDQFFNLIEMLSHGFGTAEIRQKTK